MASIAVLLIVAMAAYPLLTRHDAGTTATDGAAQGDGILIPKLKLSSGSTSAKADMIGLIVYQGRIYTQSGTSIAPEAAAALRGQAIGRTKGNINEWSKQDDYAHELASTIGPTNVYTVQGYDSRFRIMTYEVSDGDTRAELYDCLNGITVRSGADVYGWMNIAGHVRSATWQSFDSWNNGLQQQRPLPTDRKLEAFVEALLAGKPVASDKLREQDIYDNAKHPQKFIALQLDDRTEVHLRLFQEGYVSYSNIGVFVQLEPQAFGALWDSLQEDAP